MVSPPRDRPAANSSSSSRSKSPLPGVSITSSAATPSPTTTSSRSPGWRPGKVIGKIRDRRRAATGDLTRPAAHPSPPPRPDDEEEEGWHEEDDDDDRQGPSNSRRREVIKVSVRAATVGGGDGSGGGDKDEEGWWFPGKALRRGAKRLLALVKEESKRRRDGAPVVATLRLTFRGTRGLRRGIFNPYFEVICEGTKKVIKPQAFQEEGETPATVLSPRHPDTDPEWTKTTLFFDVTDITTDVHVILYDKRIRLLTVGRLILPLTNFMGRRQTLPPRTYAFDLIDDALIDAEKTRLLDQKYVPQMKLLSNSADEERVGQVVMEVELCTSHSLGYTYLASRPLLANSFAPRDKAAGGSQKEGAAAAAAEPTLASVDTQQLAINFFRLKKALEPPPLAVLLLDSPALFVPFLTLLVRSPVWSFPLYLLVAVVGNGVLTARQRAATLAQQACLEVWPPPLVERVQAMQASSARVKIRRLRGIVGWLQAQSGVLASALERSTYLFAWVDPHVTLPVEVCLALAAVLATVVLYLVPLAPLLWGLGMAVYLRLRQKRAAKAAAAANSISPPPPAIPAAPQGRNALTEEEQEEEEVAADRDAAYKVLDFDWKDWIDPRKALPALATNVLTRTPDGPELLHREIARRRAHVETADTKKQQQHSNKAD